MDHVQPIYPSWNLCSRTSPQRRRVSRLFCRTECPRLRVRGDCAVFSLCSRSFEATPPKVRKLLSARFEAPAAAFGARGVGRKRFEIDPRTSQTLRSRSEASAKASKSLRSLLRRFEAPGNLCRGCIRLYIKASERRPAPRRGFDKAAARARTIKKYMDHVQPIYPS